MDYDNGHLYGLEKFWAYLYYRKDKDKRQLKVDERLQKLISQFKTVEDFRKAQPPPKATQQDPYKVPTHVSRV